MRILNISNHEFKKMIEYKPTPNFHSMECTLYLIPTKNKWYRKYKLFKKYKNTSGHILEIKKILLVN